MKISENLIIVLTVAGLLFFPFLIWTPWANIMEFAILGHPHLISVFWSIGATDETGILRFGISTLYEIPAYFALSIPNMIFAYALISYSKNVAKKRDVILAGLIGPVLFLILGVPSTIFYLLSGDFAINLPFPLLQLMGAIIVKLMPRESQTDFL